MIVYDHDRNDDYGDQDADDDYEDNITCYLILNCKDPYPILANIAVIILLVHIL